MIGSGVNPPWSTLAVQVSSGISTLLLYTSLFHIFVVVNLREDPDMDLLPCKGSRG